MDPNVPKENVWLNPLNRLCLFMFSINLPSTRFLKSRNQSWKGWHFEHVTVGSFRTQQQWHNMNILLNLILLYLLSKFVKVTIEAYQLVRGSHIDFWLTGVEPTDAKCRERVSSNFQLIWSDKNELTPKGPVDGFIERCHQNGTSWH